MGSTATPKWLKLPLRKRTMIPCRLHITNLRSDEEIMVMVDVDHCEICWNEASLALAVPLPCLLLVLSLWLSIWWLTGTSSAVITNLIRAEVRLMRKTEASTALLINSCPVMLPRQRHWAENETFSFSLYPISVLLPRSPAIMNSLLGPNYIQGCIRSTVGPMETSAEFSLMPPSLSLHAVTPLETAFTWLNFECYTPHTSSLVFCSHLQFWNHMQFMMETGGNVCLLFAVLHAITAFYEKVTFSSEWNGQLQLERQCLCVASFATYSMFMGEKKEIKIIGLWYFWTEWNTDSMG